MSEPPKPWSIAIFETQRGYLTDFVKREISPLLDDRECRRIIVHAPVKSGKREIVEYIALRDRQDGSIRRVHAFISAWHRTADNVQREELKHHNLAVFSITNDQLKQKCIEWIQSQLALGKQVVLHLDECDFGTGERQKLGYVWRFTRDNINITNILYSATPQEVLFSGEVDDAHTDTMREIMEGRIVTYDPPTGFCGPRKFLQEGLVFEAKPFFTKSSTGIYSLSEQGRKIIQDLRTAIVSNPQRNIIVLRLSNNLDKGKEKENKSIYHFLTHRDSFPELADFIVIADKGEKFNHIRTRILRENIDWSDEDRVYWDSKPTGRPILIVIDQTSSRSTEWRCHNRIFATHDYRDSVTFSVVSQAQERVNHYAQRYGGFQPIQVYGHRKSWELSASNISYETYIKNEWMKQKIDRRIVGDVDLYKIIHTTTRILHPEHNTPVNESTADDILLDLGCGATIQVSPRVTGKIHRIPEVVCSFHPCTSQTFGSIPELSGFQNPFIRSNTEMQANPTLYPRDRGQIGYLRKWKVLQYSEIEANMGWGFSLTNTTPRITICYNNGVLGVGLRQTTGVIHRVNSMTAYKSMYAMRL